ncbi:MAG: hypothetical protein MN733_21525, partial [Nitrososphaera sp.]|nr:hypothetical protein [Nitrososphaera sp.]
MKISLKPLSKNRGPPLTAIRNQAEDERSARLDGPFFFVLALLFLDYGRPQAFFPFIKVLHPGWFIQSALFFYLVSRRLIDFRFAQTKYFVLLLLLMVIHGPIAVNNYWALQYFWITLLYFIAFLSVANFVNSYAKLIRFLDFWIIINMVGAFAGILHGGRVPGSSFMGDENDFALVMAMAIPFAYFMFLQADHFKKRLQYLCAAGVFLAANVASLSRGGFIALAAVCIFCWLKSPKKMLST